MYIHVHVYMTVHEMVAFWMGHDFNFQLKSYVYKFFNYGYLKHKHIVFSSLSLQFTDVCIHVWLE